MTRSPKRLGILGGMGPLATVDLVEKIIRATPATRDQDHVPIVIWSDPAVPARTDAILGRGPSPLPLMLAGLHGLEAAGVSAIAIPCNTAHYWYDELAASTALPILHIAHAVADELQGRHVQPARVGILATAGTLTAGFYQALLAERGYAVLLPDPDAQERRVHAGIAAVKGGDPVTAGPPLEAAAADLVDRGAEAVVLACTEIPIALRHSPLRERFLDATEALARRCVAWAFAPP